MENTPDLPELLYIFDPLCGWCYGMTPVIQRVRTDMAGQIQVSVLSGGMVTGERVPLWAISGITSKMRCRMWSGQRECVLVRHICSWERKAALFRILSRPAVPSLFFGS